MCMLRPIFALAAVLALTQAVVRSATGIRRASTSERPRRRRSWRSLTRSRRTGAACRRGEATYAAGQKVYADSCAVCHGDKLQGIPTAGIGGDKLIGGRGTLASEAPVKTVESYWPYATTLFDYVKRSMPFTAPGSLSDEQVYSVVAYILGEANILPKNAAVNASSLPNIKMPNRDGFVPDPRPEIELYR